MAAKPVPTDVKLGSSALFLPQQCGGCKHFKRIAHPAYEKTCTNLGILQESKPCERFMPDASGMKLSSPRQARNVMDLLRELGPSDLRNLATLALQERRSRKYGFKFGDTVYLQAFGDDYLSNYRRAKVVAADAKYVHIEADQGFAAMVFHGSVLTATQWRKKHKWLIDNERLTDPRYHKYIRVPSQAELQAERVKHSLDALDLNIANGGAFVEGARPEKRPERSTPLTELIVERRAVPAQIRVR